jgi:putative chitinase
MLTKDTLQQMWSNGDSKIPGLIDAMAQVAPDVFPKYGLDSDLLIAHAMAQFSHECDAGQHVEENLNYSAERLLQVFPTHFTPEVAAGCVGNPRKIADQAYNGRMGNRPGTDDGYNFRGRGAIQVTGRYGYETLGQKVGLDLLTHPELVNDQMHFLECAVAKFVQLGCLPYAKNDDVKKVTEKVNGGDNGLAERTDWLRKWKASLGIS